MGYHPSTRCREYREGSKGRRRTYTCSECHEKFQVDTLRPLPNEERACPSCRRRTGVFTFVNTRTGKETNVRASDVILATLRAKAISKYLHFKVSKTADVFK